MAERYVGTKMRLSDNHVIGNNLSEVSDGRGGLGEKLSQM